MGDASCSFNPIYGQGMTVAALQALTLRDHLTPGVARRSPRVLQALARVIDGPWELAIGADLAVPGVDGRRTPRRRIAGAYVRPAHGRRRARPCARARVHARDRPRRPP